MGLDESSEIDAPLSRSQEITRAGGQCGEHRVLMRTLSGISSAVDKLDSKFERVLERLAEGQTHFATQELRLRQLERVVYAVCSVAGVAVVGAIISLVVRR